MTKYPHPSVLLVESGSMFDPKRDIIQAYVCPEDGLDGHGIQSPLYLDPRTGDSFVYCPIHKVAFRLKDNLRVRFRNFTWRPISKEGERLRMPTKTGTKKIQGSSLTSLDIE